MSEHAQEIPVDDLIDVEAVLAIFAHFHERLGRTLPFSMLSNEERIQIASQMASAYEARRLRKAIIESASVR